MCICLQIEELKTENDELKDVMDKTGIEVQDLKEKVCVCVDGWVGRCMYVTKMADANNVETA